ncbi:HipA family kinase [Allomesorhizobium camelthorni]|uniref:HipA-like kinase domain-containing protein n=1 Tax=Allomesorhizobium camelthorni TaxID=475069 RepID=A0A6G4W6F8_9HYPH|nr:HipA family kinase [Mesorhizobium camelthorni]NGO49757.1 hypothetical protein [Mesorhizobium camelthorni]
MEQTDRQSAGGQGETPVHLVLGTVLHGASPFKLGNVNDTFRGQVLCADGEARQAIIKDLSARQLANEVMAAAIGLASKLPIPMPIIARVEPGILAVSRCPLADGSGHLVFASADTHAENVQQIYCGDPGKVPLIREKLAAWNDAAGMYGFDTWIANTDRHEGNLLFSGRSEIWLIDHGHSFTGPGWEPAHFQPDAQYNNRLSHWLTPTISDDRRREIAGPAGALPARLNGVELARLGELNYVAHILARGDFEALVAFLNARVQHVPRLASEALGLLV